MKNKTITLCELIGLITEGQAPKKIKCDNKIYTFINRDYYHNGEWLSTELSTLFEEFSIKELLNKKMIEILPEENDEWEDIEEIKHNGKRIYNPKTNTYNTLNTKEKNIFIPIINQLIKNQKYLKEKLDKYDRKD